MFRVLDDRPGSQAAVSVPRPGPLRVYAHVRVSQDAAELTGLRVLLTGDLLLRAAELGGLQVIARRLFAGDPAGQAATERAADALGIHPPEESDAPPGRRPGGPGDVHVAEDGDPDGDGGSGILLRTAAARLAADAHPGDAATGMLGGHDPIAVKLALMSVPRHQPVELSSATLARAARTLGEWRRHVARWAESPSRRIPEPVQAAFRSAFDRLDPIAALSSLGELASDETIPPGARFEAFVYADRVLGLDLPRDIGR